VRYGPRGAAVHINRKIAAHLTVRGWTEHEIRAAVDRGSIGRSIDHAEGESNPATVYGSKQGGYVVINDRTGRVVQISDRTDPGWLPDSRIEWI
jgi:filamentous hemagglutinin